MKCFNVFALLSIYVAARIWGDWLRCDANTMRILSKIPSVKNIGALEMNMIFWVKIGKF